MRSQPCTSISVNITAIRPEAFRCESCTGEKPAASANRVTSGILTVEAASRGGSVVTAGIADNFYAFSSHLIIFFHAAVDRGGHNLTYKSVLRSCHWDQGGRNTTQGCRLTTRLTRLTTFGNACSAFGCYLPWTSRHRLNPYLRLSLSSTLSTRLLKLDRSTSSHTQFKLPNSTRILLHSKYCFFPGKKTVPHYFVGSVYTTYAPRQTKNNEVAKNETALFVRW